MVKVISNLNESIIKNRINKANGVDRFLKTYGPIDESTDLEEYFDTMCSDLEVEEVSEFLYKTGINFLYWNKSGSRGGGGVVATRDDTHELFNTENTRHPSSKDYAEASAYYSVLSKKDEFDLIIDAYY